MNKNERIVFYCLSLIFFLLFSFACVLAYNEQVTSSHMHEQIHKKRDIKYQKNQF